MSRLRACVAGFAAALVIAPVATTASPRASSAACWEARVDRARAVVTTRPGVAAFALTDPSGRVWSFRGDRRFPSASLLKTTLMLAYLRRPDVRERALTASERSLLGRMIRSSDNGATNALVGRLPAAAVRAAARASGQRRFVYRLPVWGLSQTTAIDQARLFARLDRALPERHRRDGRSWLRTIVPAQRWGIPSVAPAGWTAMFKGGWGSGTGRITSQAGRLERGGVAWSVAVLTERNPSHAAGVATIERVARALVADGPC